jgi:hypothetical protein
MASSAIGDFPLEPFIDERRVDVPPPTTPSALFELLALWRSLAARGDIPHRGQLDTFTLRPWRGTS